MEKAMAPLDYSDNSVFNDIVASPDANYHLAARATKKQKFDPIKEYTDADGVEYWQLRAYGRTSYRKSKAYYTLRIRKDNFAIIDAEFEIDTSTASFDYPQSLSPWSHSKINRKTTKMHYELRNGRYTLTHYSVFKDITYYCHRHYGYELADSIQHRVESHEWIMTDLQPGDTSFLRLNPVQSHTRKDLIEAFGASNVLQEILTLKSDDVNGRAKAYEAIVKGDNMPIPSIPESFNVLIHELRGLGLEITFKDKDGNILSQDKDGKKDVKAAN